jgi:hypothetical protein
MRSPLLLVTLAVSLFSASLAFPADPPAASSQPAQVAAVAARSPIEGTDLARMLRRDTSTLMLRKSPGAGIFVDTTDGFRSVLVVQLAADGKPVISCITSEKAAEQIFAPRKPESREP